MTNSFTNAVKQKLAPPPAALDDHPPPGGPAVPRRPGRPHGSTKVDPASVEDTRQVGARLDRQTKKRLKHMAVEHETTVQALMAEAVEWIVRRHERKRTTGETEKHNEE